MNRQRTTVLAVEGMSCGSCVRHVDEALGSIDGVTSVDVRLREGQAIVRHDSREGAIDALIRALETAGYAASVEP
jgi:copper chaperone